MMKSIITMITIALALMLTSSLATAAALTFGREKLKGTSSQDTSAQNTASTATTANSMYPVGHVGYFAYGAISGDGIMYSQKYSRPQKFSRNITGVQRNGVGSYTVALYNAPADTVCMASSMQPTVCETAEFIQGSVRVTCLNASRTPHEPTFFTIQCMGP